jgi:transcriptional regulator with XRE-family HTH domain
VSENENDWFGADVATLGDRLAGAREAAGLTQSEVARRLGVRTQSIAAWEDDRSEPRANRLSMLAGVLGVSIIWLLTGEGEGVELPGDEADPAGKLRPVLSEMRRLRADLKAAEARAARLEARLSALLEDQG